MITDKPTLPLPEPLRGTEIGSFAHHTITVRLPNIVRRTLAENDFAPDAAANLNWLIDEIGNGRIRPLTDGAEWDGYTAVHTGKNWLAPPWFFSETYFYRRILEAVGYFGADGPMTRLDPFAYQKQRGLTTAMPTLRMLAANLSRWREQGWHEPTFARLLTMDLWGNQADLSLWPADEEGQPNHTDTAVQQDHTLVDDTTAVFDHLTAAPVKRIDFIIDNSGFELVGDLALADYLLSSDSSQTIRFHLKTHPTFVSDAMITDVQATIAYLQDDLDENVRALGERVARYVENGRLQLRTHPYWTSPLPGWDMPLDLQDDLAAATLIISKGDANYRRWLGDRHWPYTTPFADIVAYFPAPLVALRTLKSPVAAGLDATLLPILDQKDPNWRVNGRWGLIQTSITSC